MPSFVYVVFQIMKNNMIFRNVTLTKTVFKVNFRIHVSVYNYYELLFIKSDTDKFWLF